MSLEEFEILQDEQFSYSIHKKSIVLPKNTDHEITDMEEFNNDLKSKFLNLMVYSAIYKVFVISYNFQLFIVKSEDLNELYKSLDDIDDEEEESKTITNGEIIDDDNVLLTKITKFSIDSTINITQLCLCSDQKTLILSDTTNNLYKVNLNSILENNGELDFQLFINGNTAFQAEIAKIDASPVYYNEILVQLVNGSLYKINTLNSSLQSLNDKLNSLVSSANITAFTFHTNNVLLIGIKNSKKLYQLDNDKGTVIESSIDLTDKAEDLKIQDNEFPVHLKSLNSNKLLIIFSNQIEPEDMDDEDQEPIEFRNFIIETDNSGKIYKIDELCPPWGSILRNLFYYSVALKDWSLTNPDLLVMTSSQALELNSISSNHQLIPLNDSDRAQFPLDEITGADDTPLGLAIDLYSDMPRLQPTEEISTYEPAPRIACLTNQGKLLVWDLIDLKGIKEDKLSLEKARSYITSKISNITSSNSNNDELRSSSSLSDNLKIEDVVEKDDFFASMSLDDSTQPKETTQQTDTITASKTADNEPSTSLSQFKLDEGSNNEVVAEKPPVSNPFGSTTGSTFGSFGTSTGSAFGSGTSQTTANASDSPFASLLNKKSEEPAESTSTPKSTFGAFNKPETSSPFASAFTAPSTSSPPPPAPFGSSQAGGNTSHFGQAGFGGGQGAFKFGAFSNSLANKTESTEPKKESQVAPQTTNSAFGAFTGSSSGGFGNLNASSQNSIFGSSGFGNSSSTTSKFGAGFGTGSTFGSSTSNPFGSSTSSIFGNSGTSAFGSSATSTFGATTQKSIFGTAPQELKNTIEEIDEEDDSENDEVDGESDQEDDYDSQEVDEESYGMGSEEEDERSVTDDQKFQNLFNNATSLKLEHNDVPEQFSSSAEEREEDELDAAVPVDEANDSIDSIEESNSEIQEEDDSQLEVVEPEETVDETVDDTLDQTVDETNLSQGNEHDVSISEEEKSVDEEIGSEADDIKEETSSESEIGSTTRDSVSEEVENKEVSDFEDDKSSDETKEETKVEDTTDLEIKSVDQNIQEKNLQTSDEPIIKEQEVTGIEELEEVNVNATVLTIDEPVEAEPVYIDEIAGIQPKMKDLNLKAFGDEEDEIYLSKQNMPKPVPVIVSLESVIYPQLDENPLIAEVEKIAYDFEGQLDVIKMNIVEMHDFIFSDMSRHSVKHTKVSLPYPQFWKISEGIIISEYLDELQSTGKEILSRLSTEKQELSEVSSLVESSMAIAVDIKEQLLRPKQVEDKVANSKTSPLTFQQIQQRNKLRKSLFQIDQLEKELNSKLLILNGMAFPEKIVGDSKNLQRVIASIDNRIRSEFENLKKLKDDLVKSGILSTPQKLLLNHPSTPSADLSRSSPVETPVSSPNKSQVTEAEEKLRYAKLNETIAKQKYLGTFFRGKKLAPTYLN